MSEAIEYEILPPSAKAARAKSEKYRKLAVVVGWIGLLMGIVFIFSGNVENVFNCFFLVAGVPGWVHWNLHFKHWIHSGFIIGLIGWFFVTYLVGALTGWFYTIRDTIRIIQKKPLVNDSENKFFLMRADAQAEMQNEALAESIARHANNPAENMKKLKEMLDQGLITQAEYDRKKAELLDKM